MEAPLSDALPRWLLEISQRGRAANDETVAFGNAARVGSNSAPSPQSALALPPPAPTTVAPFSAITFTRYQLPEEDLWLHPTGPMQDDILVHVPAAAQDVYFPRQAFVQRLSGALRLAINDVSTWREDGSRHTGRINMKVPGLNGATVDREFIGDPMPNEYMAVESAAEQVIEFFRVYLRIRINDTNHKELVDKERILLTSQSFQMLHQEAAESAINNNAAARCAYDLLQQQHNKTLQENATLRGENAALQQQRDALEAERAGFAQERDSMLRQIAQLQQSFTALAEQDAKLAQDLANSLHQHNVLLEQHVATERDRAALARRFDILFDRYALPPPNRAHKMALSLLSLYHHRIDTEWALAH